MSGEESRWSGMAVAAASTVLLLSSLLVGCGDDGEAESQPTGLASTMVVLDWDGRVSLIDPIGGEVRELDLGIDVEAIGVGEDGRLLIVVEEGSATAFRLEDGGPPRLVPTESPHDLFRATGVVSPDGRRVALVDEAGSLVVIDLATGAERTVLAVADVPPEPSFACSVEQTTGTVRAWPGPIELAVTSPCEEVVFEGVVLVDPDAEEPVIEEHQGDLAVSTRGDRFEASVDSSARVVWSEGATIDLDGGFSPRWSSSGSVAFSQTRPGVGESIRAVLVLEPDSTEPIEVDRDYVDPVSWSPAGDVLVYSHMEGRAVILWTWSRSDGPRRLLELPAWPRQVVWLNGAAEPAQ